MKEEELKRVLEEVNRFQHPVDKINRVKELIKKYKGNEKIVTFLRGLLQRLTMENSSSEVLAQPLPVHEEKVIESENKGLEEIVTPETKEEKVSVEKIEVTSDYLRKGEERGGKLPSYATRSSLEHEEWSAYMTSEHARPEEFAPREAWSTPIEEKPIQLNENINVNKGFGGGPRVMSWEEYVKKEEEERVRVLIE